MFTKKWSVVVEDTSVVSYVRILGKYGVQFEMSDEWYIDDQIDPNHKHWYRTFGIYATKKTMTAIDRETRCK